MPKKVLIVHHDAASAQKIGGTLEQSGHQAVVHTDVLGVVATVTREAPDLIVIELERPLVDGQEVSRLIRKNPRTKDIPIAFFAENSDESTRAKAVALGVQGLIDGRGPSAHVARRIEDLLVRRKPLLPVNEAGRIEALRGLRVLDTPPEPILDEIVHAASAMTATPIALVSLVDAERQWFKSRVGLPASETPREHAFCAHSIHGSQLFEVADASQDIRFAENPLVTADPNIRFYAGAPLVTRDGYGVGTLCVIDRVPRTLTPDQREALARLGRAVTLLLEDRRGPGGRSAS